MTHCLPASLSNSGLLITAAFPLELRFLIDHFRAKRVNNCHPWALYASHDQRVLLLETNCGMISCASALSFAYGRLRIPSAWVLANVGIAGSGDYPIGTWVEGHSVWNSVTDKTTFLHPHALGALPSCCINTYPAPSSDYGRSGVLDMESAGFVDSVKRLTSSSQMAIFKLVTDTPETDYKTFSKPVVQQLLYDKSDQLLPVLHQLLNYSEKQYEATNLPLISDDLWARMHFSLTQRRQLERLWRSFRLFYSPEMIYQQADRMSSSRELLAWVEKKLNQVTSHWTNT